MKTIILIGLLSVCVTLGFCFYFFTMNNTKREIASSPQCRMLHKTCRYNYECCSHNCDDRICRRNNSNDNKRYIGQYCLTPQNCYSRLCLNRRCVGSAYQKAYIGQYCTLSVQCKSLYCSMANRICKGSSALYAEVGQICDHSGQCLSKYCDLKYHKCAGTQFDLARYNEFCSQNRQCRSGFCDTNISSCR